LAKNRYGWNKRVKEIARKMKKEEKIKRRQNKSKAKAADDLSENHEEDSLPGATD
jgi:hypothetical protein